MKIAFFTDSYKPQVNGVVTSIDLFTNELRRRGHDVSIFAPNVPDFRDKDRFVYRFSSVPFHSYREYRIGVPVQLIKKNKIKENMPDIIHIHSPFSVGALGIGLAKHYDIPVVGTFHTMFPDYTHYFVSNKLSKNKRIGKLAKKASWKMLAWLYNKCDCVVAPSERIRNVIKSRGIKSETYVVPTGIKIRKRKKNKNTLRKKHGFGKEKILLHVGRVTKEKNIEFLLKSLSSTLSGDTKLVIASDGPHADEVKRYAEEQGIADHVVFTGYLSEKSLQDFYAMADAFVFASRTETQGLVLLEAAIHGLPAAVLDAPVTGDFVRENGTGIAAKKDFSKAVDEILNNRNLRRRVQRKSKNMEKKYDIRHCASDLLDIYSRIQSQ